METQTNIGDIVAEEVVLIQEQLRYKFFFNLHVLELLNLKINSCSS